MTKIYQGLGLSCMYPENWNILEDTEDGKVVGFTLESPSSAFMAVSEYPWTVAPREAVDQAHEALQSEYEDLETEDIDPALEWKGQPLQDSRAKESRFYYLDLLIVARFIAFTVERKTYLVQIQAEDRDFQSLEIVFKAMIVSILNSIAAASQEDDE